MTRASLSPDRLVAPAPMLATLGPAPSGDQFAIEVKFDGQRGLLTVDRRVRVTSRNGADITETFPELSAVAAAVGGRRMVLDGEIVAVDEHGRPSFRRLQRRWPQQRRPGAQLVREVPTRYLAFDVMNIEGEDITHWPYRERRELLDTLMVMESSPALTVPRHWTDVAPADMLAICADHGHEGIVCKRLDSPYRSGRSRDWIKSPVRATTEAVIVGAFAGRRGEVGALLLAAHDEAGRLVLLGQVGTGFSGAERRRLATLLAGTEVTAPPVAEGASMSGVQWFKPRYVGEVAYREYHAGKGLRHASWKGLRTAPVSGVCLPRDAGAAPG
ncbi:non-homologous end-joining DNA ligase [Mycolicibacterium obuense]|uniref:non-homologous end-joining DNA ligase n=1 Tax=Mycolicibacterium obuense TaxID=1807 RepID=UPI0009E59BDE|nr:non-homologous end-joining DNA ligase [Mycolicibacterium obuense]